MHSDKHYSIMARVTGLISSLINVVSSRDVPFHQPQYSRSNACIMVLSQLTFVLQSFLHYRKGDDLWYVRYGFGETRVSAVLAGVLFTLFST